MSCFVLQPSSKSSYSAIFTEKNIKKKGNALRKFRKLREGKPDLFAVTFLVKTWNRTRAEFGEAIREGVRTLLRILPEGANREDLTALALSPYKGSTKRMWRWPDVFDFESSRGIWCGRILPELEDDLGQARIRGGETYS